MRLIALCACISVSVVGINAQAQFQAAALMTNDVPTLGSATNSSNNTPGIRLVLYPSHTVTTLYGGQVTTVEFSPDGKKIAFTRQDPTYGSDALYTMNNDGTDLQYSGRNCVGCYQCTGGRTVWPTFKWSSNGILYYHNEKIYRYVPETNTVSTICNILDFGTPCRDNCTWDYPANGTFLHASRDGRKVWIWTCVTVPSIPGFNCSNPYLTFSSDFSSYRVEGYCTGWGHGRDMTADGYMVFVRCADHRYLDPVVEFGPSMPPTVIYHDDNGGATATSNGGISPVCKPAIPIPCPTSGDNAGYNFPACINNDSLAVAACMGSRRDIIYNWRSGAVLGEFQNAGLFQSWWAGALPDPHDNQPFIIIDKSQLTFVLQPSQATDTLALTATNSSSTPLGKVDVSCSANWCTAVVQGNGGDSQAILAIVTQSAMPADANDATITISGGNASNTVQCAVAAYRGQALPPPTNLSAQASGDSLLDASLAWADNASTESGYIVERRATTGDTLWHEVARTAANATTHVDQHLAYPATYLFRVRAFRNLSAGAVQESENSNEASVIIEGIPWIRVNRPLNGETVRSGGSYTVRWSANLVPQVRIKLSLDHGRNWTDINPLGGIAFGSRLWDNYSFQMPGEEYDQARIKVTSYEEQHEGFSGIFRISAVGGGSPLAAGYLRQLLQLENTTGGTGAEVLNSSDSTAIEARYVGASRPTPGDGEQFSVNGRSYTWRIRTDGDGVWSDGAANENYVSYWSVVIVSPDQRSISIGYRCDDNMTVWRNGALWLPATVWDANSERTSGALTLESGENRLLLKLREGVGGNYMAARLLSGQGADLSDLFYMLPTYAPVAEGSVPKASHAASKLQWRLELIESGRKLTLVLSEPARFVLRIYSPSGKLICSAKGTGSTAVILPPMGFHSGIFLVRGTVGTRTISQCLTYVR